MGGDGPLFRLNARLNASSELTAHCDWQWNSPDSKYLYRGRRSDEVRAGRSLAVLPELTVAFHANPVNAMGRRVGVSPRLTRVTSRYISRCSYHSRAIDR